MSKAFIIAHRGKKQFKVYIKDIKKIIAVPFRKNPIIPQFIVSDNEESKINDTNSGSNLD